MPEEIKWKNFTELAKFKNNDKQLYAWKLLKQENCKYLLYGGAMHGGKSYFLRWAAIGLSLLFYKQTGQAGISIGLFSENYPTLRDRQISRIKMEFPAWLGELKSTQNEGHCFFIRDEYGGGKILLRNLDDPSKYQSTEFAAILVEELTKNTEEVFNILKTRLRYPNIKNTKFVGATNPGGVGHTWCQKRWIHCNGGGNEQNLYHYVKATLDDNKFTTDEYRQSLNDLPERLYKAYVLGDWDAFEGQFFYTFNPQIQLIEPHEIPEGWTLVGSLDPAWGGVGSFGLQARDYDGKIYRIATLVQEKMSADERAIAIKSFIQNNKYTGGRMPSIIVSGHDAWAKKDRYAIMASDKTMYDVFADNGLYLTKAILDRQNGWGALRAVMPNDYFIFKNYNQELVDQLAQTLGDEKHKDDILGCGNNPHVVDHTIEEARYGNFALYIPPTPKSSQKENVFAIIHEKSRRKVATTF